jgi:hypothetical protein
MNLLDHDGKPLEQKKEPHKFGCFNVPADARVTFRNLHTETVGYRASLVMGMRDKKEGAK